MQNEITKNRNVLETGSLTTAITANEPNCISDNLTGIRNLSADYTRFVKYYLSNNYEVQLTDFYRIETLIHQLDALLCDQISKSTRIALFNSNLPVLNISESANHSISSATSVKNSILFSTFFGCAKYRTTASANYKKSNTKLYDKSMERGEKYRMTSDKLVKKSSTLRKPSRKIIYNKKSIVNRKEINNKNNQNPHYEFERDQFEMEIVKNLEQILNNNNDDIEIEHTHSTGSFTKRTNVTNTTTTQNKFADNYHNLLCKNVAFIQTYQNIQNNIKEEQKQLSSFYLRHKLDFRFNNNLMLGKMECKAFNFFILFYFFF